MIEPMEDRAPQGRFSSRIHGQAPAAFWDELRARTRPEHRILAVASFYDAWVDAYVGKGHWRAPIQTIAAYDPLGRSAGALFVATLQIRPVRIAAVGGLYQPFRTMPLASDAVRDAATALAQALADQTGFFAIRLGACQEPDEGLMAFAQALRAHGWSVHREVDGFSYMINLPGTIEALHAKLNKRLTHDVRYFQRKLEKAGRVTYRLFNHEPSDTWAHVISDLSAIEMRSWLQSKGGDMRFAGDENQRYWGRLLADPELSRAARAWVIYLDDTPVSFVFALDSGATRYVLANQFDEAIAAYSTGSILYYKAFADAVEQKIEWIHLGAGDSGYKRRWSAEPARVMTNCVFCRPSTRGRAMFLALTARQIARAMRATRSLATETSS